MVSNESPVEKALRNPRSKEDKDEEERFMVKAGFCLFGC